MFCSGKGQILLQTNMSLMTRVTGHLVLSPIWLTPYSGAVLLVRRTKASPILLYK